MARPIGDANQLYIYWHRIIVIVSDQFLYPGTNQQIYQRYLYWVGTMDDRYKTEQSIIIYD